MNELNHCGLFLLDFHHQASKSVNLSLVSGMTFLSMVPDFMISKWCAIFFFIAVTLSVDQCLWEAEWNTVSKGF